MADSPETDALRNDMEQLRKDFSALSEKVKENSEDKVQAGLHKAREGAQVVEKEIEARPFIGMVTAFGIGLLIGKTLSH